MHSAFVLWSLWPRLTNLLAQVCECVQCRRSLHSEVSACCTADSRTCLLCGALCSCGLARRPGMDVRWPLQPDMLRSRTCFRIAANRGRQVLRVRAAAGSGASSDESMVLRAPCRGCHGSVAGLDRLWARSAGHHGAGRHIRCSHQQACRAVSHECGRAGAWV